jgi:pimeloyl-ACP methyl ester carboxylesterase
MLAAVHPQRVRTVTLVNGYARHTAGPGYPHGLEPTAMSGIMRAIHTPDADALIDVVTWRLPAVVGDVRFRAWWEAIGRRAASPRTAELVHDLIAASDVRDYLPAVTAPVLLLVRTGCASYDPGHGRYLLEHLSRAHLRERSDPNDAWFVGNVDWIVDELNAFTRTHH